jgi:histidinol-phosphate aminotransferase
METIYLDRNESQYGPAPACFDVLSNARREDLTCYTRDYDRGVKSRVTERLAAHFGLPEHNVLLGYGAELLLKMAVHRFVKPGETLMVPDASWWYYGAIAHEVGAGTCTFPVIARGDNYVYDTAAMKRAYDEHTPAVVLIASPNNPTGNSISRTDLREVLEHFRESVVIIDEAYWGFGSTDDSHVAEIISTFDNVIIIRSFSKYYALAGVRMGYAVVSDRFKDFGTYTTLFLGYQPIAENLVLAALDSPEYYSDLARRFDEDKSMFYGLLAPYSCITCYRSDANFLLFRLHPEISGTLKDRLAEGGIKAKFFTEPLFLNHLRLSLGTREQNAIVLETMVAVAEDFIRKNNEYPIAV